MPRTACSVWDRSAGSLAMRGMSVWWFLSARSPFGRRSDRSKLLGSTMALMRPNLHASGDTAPPAWGPRCERREPDTKRPLVDGIPLGTPSTAPDGSLWQQLSPDEKSPRPKVQGFWGVICWLLAPKWRRGEDSNLR